MDSYNIRRAKRNNSTHLCFPFSRLSLNDLLNFSVILLDDNNKKIEFNANKKKLVFLILALMYS